MNKPDPDFHQGESGLKTDGIPPKNGMQSVANSYYGLKFPKSFGSDLNRPPISSWLPAIRTAHAIVHSRAVARD
jgi:hypothetical protein